MKYLKLVILTLLISLSLGGVANAEAVPLSKTEEMVQQHAEEVEHKEAVLQSTTQEIEDLAKKKQELAQKLESEKKLIEELKAKIAEKKRVEAIRAEEQARLAAYVAPALPYTPPQKRYAGNSAGNLYTPGQCTWHVKNMKPELPNDLGNADTWFWNAQAQGWPTGYAARPGAAAQTKAGMHVTYVLEVYNNGTMLISEMNYAGPYSQRNTVVNQSDYLYIY